MGFCYGGGKALAYSSKYKTAKATVVVYGKPVRFYSQNIIATRILERYHVMQYVRILRNDFGEIPSELV